MLSGSACVSIFVFVFVLSVQPFLHIEASKLCKSSMSLQNLEKCNVKEKPNTSLLLFQTMSLICTI